MKSTALWSMVLCGLATTVAFGNETVLERASGAWFFDTPGEVLAAQKGSALELVGEHEIIEGPGGKPAVHIGKGSHYRCLHGIQPADGTARVNQYTLVMDVRSTLEERYYALVQTDPENKTDNDCEIMNRERAIGSSVPGRSRVGAIEPNAWTRIALVVDNPDKVFDIYVNGERVLQGVGQEVDGRYGLQEALLLFADEDGDDNAMDVSRVICFGFPLNPEQLKSLNAEVPLCPDGRAPSGVDKVVGPDKTQTGTGAIFQFEAVKETGEMVQYRVDWDDGDISPWSELQPTDRSFKTEHVFYLPGEKELRVQLRDACSLTSEWLPLARVQVDGEARVFAPTDAYLQHLRTDGITIMWEANVNLTGSVLYGPSDGDLAHSAEASVAPSGHGTFIYRTVLDGLEPGSEYIYRAVLAEEYEMGGGAFRTAPEAFEPFSFAVWSDSQGFSKTNKKEPLEPTISMMKHIAKSGVNLAVTSGDLAEDGADYMDTHRFFLGRVAKHLGTKVPFFIAWGNHDSYRGAVIRKFADAPSKDREGFEPGYGSYAFTYAQCRFICLDYATMYSDIDFWLEDELQSEAATTARYRFLFVHVPPFGEIWIDGDARLRETLVPLLEEYNVAACFSGHTHAYERGFLNEVHYVTTGAGSWLDHGEPVVKEWPHFLVGGKNPVGDFEHGLVNEYVRVYVEEDGWRAACIAFNPDGTEIGVIDTFGSTGP